MAGDFFKRKGLLPNKGSPGKPELTSAGRAPWPAFVPSDGSEDAFSRPTLVPETPPRDDAASWELAQRATTTRAPRSVVTVPAARPERASSTSLPPDESEERVTVNVSDVPAAGPHALLAHRAAHPAIHPPPAHSLAPGSVEEVTVVERRALATRETVTDMPEPMSGPRSDSGQSALGFVDALPRATSIPPERTSFGGTARVAPERSSVTSLSELYALSDFSGALEVAERRLEADPSDAEAQRYIQDCRRVLIKMQLSRLGSLQQIVELAVDSTELQWLTIDHRAGFLLSLIDGLSTLEDLLDICGMQRLQALQIFADLVEQKVVRLRPLVTF